jgi:hypothetical protein
MGLRRPTRQSHSGIRAESRTGREIPRVAVAPAKPPRKTQEQMPPTETVKSRPEKTPSKPTRLGS